MEYGSYVLIGILEPMVELQDYYFEWLDHFCDFPKWKFSYNLTGNEQ